MILKSSASLNFPLQVSKLTIFPFQQREDSKTVGLAVLRVGCTPALPHYYELV